MRLAALALVLVAGATSAQETASDGWTGPAEPTAVSAEDRASLASCLRDAADLPRACIGTIAVACARTGAAPGAQTQAGREVACSRREADAWRERLDLVGGALAARLESGPRSRLGAAQRSWETYTVQKCAFAAEMQQPERAASMQAACSLREVASRAIEMERLAARPAQRPQGRPMIQR